MPTSLGKDFVFLLAGALLGLALESERDALNEIIGPGHASLLCFVVFVILIGGYLVFRHYIALLGAGGSAPGSALRLRYDTLRASLSDGGTPARVYAQWLERALLAVERFFGEAEASRRGVVQRMIGLSRPASLWTAPALDRCILFAFIYPQAMIILGWVISGVAGPAEQVLGLITLHGVGQRFTAVAGLGFSIAAYWNAQNLVGQMSRSGGIRFAEQILPFLLWLFALVAGMAVTALMLGVSTASVGGAVIVSSSVTGAIAGDLLVAMGSGLVGAALAAWIMAATGNPFLGCILASLACAIAGFLAAHLEQSDNGWMRLRARLRQSQAFWWMFLAASIAVYVLLARILPALPVIWPMAKQILLFYGLLCALNAPFLWLSLGLTRALLWLGLERKGWWPYFYALVDAALAVLGVMVLVAIMILGVELLNGMAVRGGSAPILDIPQLLNGVDPMAKTVTADRPEYWWVYTMLLSAMLPSLANLAVGGFSLIRGIPALSRYLHARLPEGRAVPEQQRTATAAVLSFQLVAGLALGIVAQFVLLPVVVLGYLLPGLGLGILEQAHNFTRWAQHIVGQL